MRWSVGAAYQALVQAQKPVRGISLYSRFVNRRLGRLFAAVAAAIGLTPNAVTVVSAVLTVAAVALIATRPPGPVVGVLIAVALVLAFALDAADGQLARLLQRSSPGGEWFDHVVDAGKAVCLHAAVLISAFRFFDVGLGWLLVPLGYQAVGVVIQAGGTLRELLGRMSTGPGKPSGPGNRWSPVMLLVADSGVFGLLFSTWGWPRVFVVGYTVFFAANALIGAALLVKWMRELSAAPTAAPR